MSVTFNKAQMTFLQKQFDTMSVDMVGKMLGSEDGYDEDEAMELASSIFTTKGFKMTKTTKSTKSLKNTSDDEDDEDTAKVSKAKSRTKKTVKVKDPNRPKRAKTAFIIWSSSPEGVKQIKVDNLFLSHAMNFSFDEEKKEFSLQRTPDKDGTGYSKYMPALNHKALSSMTKKELDGYIVALKESVKTVEETKILPYTPLIKEAKSGDQKSIERLKEIISVSYLHELTTDEIASEAN